MAKIKLIPTIIRLEEETIEDIAQLWPHHKRAEVIRKMIKGYIAAAKAERKSA